MKRVLVAVMLMLITASGLQAADSRLTVAGGGDDGMNRESFTLAAVAVDKDFMPLWQSTGGFELKLRGQARLGYLDAAGDQGLSLGLVPALGLVSPQGDGICRWVLMLLALLRMSTAVKILAVLWSFSATAKCFFMWMTTGPWAARLPICPMRTCRKTMLALIAIWGW